MPYKPMPLKVYLAYLKIVNWNLEKGSIDWKLYDSDHKFVCSIKVAHGNRTKQEVIAHSVKKTENAFKEEGLSWPPKKK